MQRCWCILYILGILRITMHSLNICNVFFSQIKHTRVSLVSPSTSYMLHMWFGYRTLGSCIRFVGFGYDMQLKCNCILHQSSLRYTLHQQTSRMSAAPFQNHHHIRMWVCAFVRWFGGGAAHICKAYVRVQIYIYRCQWQKSLPRQHNFVFEICMQFEYETMQWNSPNGCLGIFRAQKR